MKLIWKLLVWLEVRFINLGLEYIVEVHCHEVGRHTIFKCLLCGESVDESNGMWNILQHLHKLSHKLHYLVSLRDLTN